MTTPEDKAEALRQQVFSKIRWGAREQEVLDWLTEKHRMTGEEAEQLVAEGFRAKRKAVREHALIRLVLSIFGIVFVLVFFYIRYFNGVIFMGTLSIFSTVFAFGIGAYSIGTLFRSARYLFSGERDGAVE